MSPRTAFALLSALILGPAAPAAAADAPLAVLMARQGEVRVVRGGASLDGQFGMHLNAGDEVRTGADSSADVMFAAGHAVHLGPGSSVTVQGARAAAPAPAQETGAFASMQRFLKLKESRGTSSLATLRSAGGADELQPVAPCQTKVREARPTFRWRADPSAGPLRLTVYHDGGVLWQADAAAGDACAWPADAPAPEPGVRYSWTVETTDPLRFPPLRSPASFFEVIGDAQARALDAALAAAVTGDLSPAGRATLRASVLYEHGLLDEAIAAVSEALSAGADDPDLRSILAHLYVQSGRVNEAMAEYDRLLAPR